METILYNLNANFVVQRPNGFVGVIHISVSLAIKDNVMEITFQNIQKINYRNVRVLANVLLEVIMVKMDNKKC
jgi:hypothetical protein